MSVNFQQIFFTVPRAEFFEQGMGDFSDIVKVSEDGKSANILGLEFKAPDWNELGGSQEMFTMESTLEMASDVTIPDEYQRLTRELCMMYDINTEKRFPFSFALCALARVDKTFYKVTNTFGPDGYRITVRHTTSGEIPKTCLVIEDQVTEQGENPHTCFTTPVCCNGDVELIGTRSFLAKENNTKVDLATISSDLYIPCEEKYFGRIGIFLARCINGNYGVRPTHYTLKDIDDLDAKFATEMDLRGNAENIRKLGIDWTADKVTVLGREYKLTSMKYLSEERVKLILHCEESMSPKDLKALHTLLVEGEQSNLLLNGSIYYVRITKLSNCCVRLSSKSNSSVVIHSVEKNNNGQQLPYAYIEFKVKKEALSGNKYPLHHFNLNHAKAFSKSCDFAIMPSANSTGACLFLPPRYWVAVEPVAKNNVRLLLNTLLRIADIEDIRC